MAKSNSKRRAVAAHDAGRLPWLGLAVAGAILALGALVIVAVTRSGQANRPAPEVVGAPRVQVTPEAIDHGDVRFDTPVESVFLVRNVGDQPLIVLGEPRVELIEGC